MTDTFSPSIAPDYQAAATDTPRMKLAQFGDGYSQRAADGLNYKDRVVTLTWSSLSSTQFTEINDTFFEAHTGGTAFYYTLPLESTQMTWMWIKKTAGYVGGSYRSLSVDLKRVYDL